jgi:2-polyprenyl-6-methoxyphenol hydroxylase-like FAD-dependent oxidoreductase/predicted DsbA family dithiol-disulfide isomerase
MEPHLKKFSLSYGHLFNIQYKMGGLLPYWEQYSSVLISRPLDIAKDWDVKSTDYQMPIDGDIWREDPVESSYPASIAFKAIEIQSIEKSIKYLRIIREMVFTKKMNITKWKYLFTAAKEVGCDLEQFKMDYDGAAREVFYQDIEKAKLKGIKIFPTIIMSNSLGHSINLKGYNTYEVLEEELMKLYFKTKKKYYNQEGISLFDKQSSLTTKEFADLKSISLDHAESILHRFEKNNKIKSHKTKNGVVWTKNKITIIGGGIAGLTLGNLLEKKSLDYQVFKKEEEKLEGEKGIMVSGKGINILKSIIPIQGLSLAGTQICNYKSFDHKGRSLSKSPLENTYIFSRNKLIDLLKEKLPADKIYNGLELKDINQDKSIVNQVDFNGVNSQSINPEIVIAADGAKSRVRDKLFPNIELSPVPENEIISIVKCKKIAKELGSTFKKYIDKEGGLALGLIRMSKKKVVWFIQFNSIKYPDKLESASQKKKFIETYFSNWDAPIYELLDKTDFNHSHLWKEFQLKNKKQINKINTLFLGDPLSPSIPLTSRGPTQALEDAKLFSDLVSTNSLELQSDIEFLFDQYNEIRNQDNETIDSQTDKFLKDIINPLSEELEIV